jgi:hypothetical protein
MIFYAYPSDHVEMAIVELPRSIFDTYEFDDDYARHFSFSAAMIKTKAAAAKKTERKNKIIFSEYDLNVETKVSIDGDETVIKAGAMGWFETIEKYDQGLKRTIKASIIIDSERFISMLNDIIAVDDLFTVELVESNKKTRISPHNEAKEEIVFTMPNKVGTCLARAKNDTVEITGTYKTSLARKDKMLAKPSIPFKLYLGTNSPLKIESTLSTGDEKMATLSDDGVIKKEKIIIKHYLAPKFDVDDDELLQD